MRQRAAAVIVCAAAVLVALSLGGDARAQAAPPSAETVLDNYVKAVGGRAAFDKLNTRVAKGRIEMPAAGISMTLTAWVARPNKTRTLIESDIIGRIERGFDGSVAWELSTTGGPRVLDGARFDDVVRDSRFDGLTAWREWVVKAESQGAADVEGKPAWKVLITPKRGAPETLFFDQASFLLVKIEVTVNSAMGDVPTENFVGDYRDVGGLRLPHRIRQKAAGQELVTVLESITHDGEIPAGQFDLPKEIQALVAKK
jgi:zinc protease